MKKLYYVLIVMLGGCALFEDLEQKNGTNSIIEVVDEAPSADCENGGIKIVFGLDKNQSNHLEAEEISSTKLLCHGSGGVNTIVSRTPEPSGENCSSGGFALQWGSDKNQNQSLDNEEIAGTTYICNESVYLIEFITESPGTGCIYGGYRFISGMDTNGNGVVDENEIQTTKFLCNQEPAHPISIITPLDSAIIQQPVEIDFTVDESLSIVRFEYYVDFSLYQAFEKPPVSLTFDNNRYAKGSAHDVYLSIMTKEGKRFNSNVVRVITGVLSKPTHLNVEFPDKATARLTWMNSSNSASGNKIYRNVDNGVFTVLETLSLLQTVFLDMTIDTLHTYSYKVEAFNAAENHMSDIVSVQYDQDNYEKDAEFRPFTSVASGKLKISRDGENISVTRSHTTGNCALINLSSGTVLPLTGHDSEGAYGTCFSSDGSIVATGGYGDNLVKLWDVSSQTLLRSFLPEVEGVFAMAFSNADQLFAVGGFLDYIKVYNTNDWSVHPTRDGHSVTRSLLFSSDDRHLLSAGNDNTGTLWDQNGNIVTTFTGHSGHIGDAVFSLDEAKVLTASYEDNKLIIWDARLGTQIDAFQNNAALNGLQMSKGGRVIIGDNNGNIKLLNMESLDLLNTFPLFNTIRSLDYSPIKEIIAVYLMDGKVIVLKKQSKWEIII
jgi:WD40 repeat protein